MRASLAVLAMSVFVLGGATAAYADEAEPSFVVHPPAAFSDVEWDAKFFDEIRWLVSQHITTGYSDGSFHPTEFVSREAFAAFLYRLDGKPKVSLPAKSPFKDVKKSAHFYKEIVWLSTEGISSGWPDGTFRPQSKITREAVAAFLYRFEGKPAYKSPNRSPFKDMKTNSKFYKEVTWLAKSGATTGYSDGTFRPRINVSREAVAAFLYRGNTILPRDGRYKVGIDIEPGFYTSIQAGFYTCVWERYDQSGEQVGWNFTYAGRNVVEIKNSDRYFETRGCLGWTPLRKISPTATSFGDGISVVGFHMQAGLYSSTAEHGCEWARYSGLGGYFDDVVEEGEVVDKPPSVRLHVGESIRVFQCDVWHRVGS